MNDTVTTNKVKAKGWAVFFKGEIDMRTVGPTRRAAIVNWLYTEGKTPLYASDSDEYIDMLWEQKRRVWDNPGRLGGGKLFRAEVIEVNIEGEVIEDPRVEPLA